MAPPRDPAVPAEFARLVDDKRLIEAIKWLRQSEGLDLQGAKERLDTYLATGSLPLKARPPRTGVSAHVRSLLNQGQLMEAIKTHRQETGLGLAESKAAVDAFIASDTVLHGRFEDERRTRRRRLITWMLVSDVVILGAVAYYLWGRGA
jgi:ribosomal protein L7/L12